MLFEMLLWRWDCKGSQNSRGVIQNWISVSARLICLKIARVKVGPADANKIGELLTSKQGAGAGSGAGTSRLYTDTTVVDYTLSVLLVVYCTLLTMAKYCTNPNRVLR